MSGQHTGWEVQDVITGDQPDCCERSGRATVAWWAESGHGCWAWASCGIHWPGEFDQGSSSGLGAVLTDDGWVVGSDSPRRWNPENPGQVWIHHPQVSYDRLRDLALDHTVAELRRLGVAVPDVPRPATWDVEPYGHPLEWVVCVLLAGEPRAASMLVERVPRWRLDYLERSYPEFRRLRDARRSWWRRVAGALHS